VVVLNYDTTTQLVTGTIFLYNANDGAISSSATGSVSRLPSVISHVYVGGTNSAACHCLIYTAMMFYNQNPFTGSLPSNSDIVNLAIGEISKILHT